MEASSLEKSGPLLSFLEDSPSSHDRDQSLCVEAEAVLCCDINATLARAT